VHGFTSHTTHNTDNSSSKRRVMFFYVIGMAADDANDVFKQFVIAVDGYAATNL